MASDRRCHGVSVLNETVVRGSRTVIGPAQSAFYLHVDDGAFVSDASRQSDALMHGTAEGLEDIGFRVGTKTVAQECLKIVGYEVERSPARLRLPAFKALLLYRVMRHLAAQLEVDTGLVRSAQGVWVWAAMLRRDVLSAAFHVFFFVQFFDGARAQWWKLARLEFNVMAGLIMGMFADTGAPLALCHRRSRSR